MAEGGVPGKKRPWRSVSLGDKVRKRANKLEAEEASPSASIVSFFSKVPPSTVACPLCGQTVPRYQINQHIDGVCQKSQNTDRDVVPVESASGVGAAISGGNQPSPPGTYSAKDAPALEKNPPTPEGSGLKRKLGAGEPTSPYFKGSDRSMGSSSTPAVRAVKNISLGSLASKLSRRRYAQGGNRGGERAKTCLIPDAQDSAIERSVGDATLESGSQKENCFPFSRPDGQRSLEGSLKSTLGTQVTVRGCGPGALQASSEDSIHASVPLDDLDCSDFALPAEQGSEQPKSPTDPVSNPGQRVECLAADGEAGPSDLDGCGISSGEHVALSPAKRKPFQRNQKPSFRRGDAKRLPVEGPLDLRNEMADGHVRLSEKPPVGNMSGVVLGMRPDPAGSAADSGGHPYYLQNFLRAVRAVLEESDDVRLFDAQELLLVAGGQKLYVRLFQRKLNWIKTSKLKYAEIADDLSPYVEELIGGGFLESDSGLQDLPEVLDLLSAPELKTLAQAFHLANPNAQKHQLLDGFLKLAKQRSIFSSDKSGIRSQILKRAKDLAGKSIRLRKDPRDVFSRLLLLFTLTDPPEEEEAGSGGQKALSTLLLVNLGRTAFPAYTVKIEHLIFEDREDFLRYAAAVHTSSDVSVAMANRDWEEAQKLYKSAKDTWRELGAHPSLRHHAALPAYLRCFTVGWVYTRILSRGVEILQRFHRYKEAVEQLEELLAQEVYCTDSRGRWWDRLALNLHQHLKETEKAADCIRKGLLDPLVRTGHRLALSQRAQRMRESPACKKLRHLLQDLPAVSVEDVAHVTIRGKLCPQTRMGKSVFIMEDLGPDDTGEDREPAVVVCSVEELALAHYKQKGFDQGIHGEGSTFSTLYGLLMWDLLFMDGIPDVFRNPYQSYPLDLYTDSFYENRKEAVDARLRLLHDASPETLSEWIADVWNAQKGRAAALVSWDRFSSLEQAQSLACCFGGPFLSGVCRRLSRDLRHYRGGLPDLVVWRSEDRQFKLVEVKGPNDRLSFKQMLWLAELGRLGAAVEVCHVTAVGSKSERLN
ncbi:fanconi-associated nuclease 1 isoform X2 [Sphaerodactylus townsendi]|uniref:fanconi-associated nuclease 1 isoform X2 n=1 Tax=Sphaerodactylus townsendi TaxID=933632 RepID=UPI002025C7AC|nr:fanconi-associated nuclease 1 isoform X2 [Sphaerodactylus townsendi]